MNQQIVSYIQQQLKSGYDINSIKNFLLQQGYNPKDVNEAAEFVNSQRLSSLADYIRSSLSRGIDPDTLRSQLSASGYPMPDINGALREAQKHSKPTSLALIVLVALVIFGLGLFFFWPSGKAEKTTSPGITENAGIQNAPESEPSMEFEKEPTVAVGEAQEQEAGQEAEQQAAVTEADFPEEPAEEEPKETEFSAETSSFEDLMDKASKETNMDSALAICDRAESTMYKDACYSQLSRSFDNSVICAKISDEQYRDECYLRIVLKNKDYALCENIVDSSLYNSCIQLGNTSPPENTTLDDVQEWDV